MLERCSEYRDTICLSDVICTCDKGEYIKVPCNTETYRGKISNVTCAKISSYNCSRGFYKEADPTPFSDIDCRMCPSSCPDGYFQSTLINSTSKFFGTCPFECAPCKTCSKGSYEIAACNAVNVTVCQTPCPECDQDSYRIEECSGRMKTKCQDCSSAPFGMYIPVQGRCTRFNDSRPVPCKYHYGDPSRPCLAGQYIEKSCNTQ